MTSKPNEPPRWRRTPDQRPRQILEAGLAIFGDQGLAGARLDDIAERAGISKGTIYLYFESKDVLFREVIHDAFTEMVELAAAVPETDDATADLKAFCRTYFAFLRSQRFETAYRLVMAELHAFPELSRDLGREVREPMRQIVRKILERGVRSGAFSKGNSQVRARMLLALLWQHGIWCARRQYDADLAGRSDTAVLNEVVSFFLTAVTNVE